MKYSKSTGGFYSPEIHGTAIPSDAVTVLPEDYFRLTNSGLPIVGDDRGYPINVDPPAPVPFAPSSVSPAQASIALERAGLLTQVEAIIAGADIETQIAWKKASVIERSSPTVAALSAALGLTDAQLDDLFTAAANIFV